MEKKPGKELKKQTWLSTEEQELSVQLQRATIEHAWINDFIAFIGGTIIVLFLREVVNTSNVGSENKTDCGVVVREKSRLSESAPNFRN